MKTTEVMIKDTASADTTRFSIVYISTWPSTMQYSNQPIRRPASPICSAFVTPKSVRLGSSHLSIQYETTQFSS